MEENIIQNNGEIMINIDVSVKNVMHVTKNYVWNLATCSCENGYYLESFIDDSAIICDKVIDADAEVSPMTQLSRTRKKQKQFLQILMKRRQPLKRKISMFYLHFYKLL